MFAFPSIVVPSSNSAHTFISSNVTGNTFPVIFKISFVFSIDCVKSLQYSFIAYNNISPKANDCNLPSVNFKSIIPFIVSSSVANEIILSFTSSSGIVAKILLESDKLKP